jgi:energy-coupling factor transporter ATP-binding protein EcfA2
VALRLTGVACEYAPGTAMASRALDGVSLVLEPGTLTVVLGPTGSGKTTLLRAAAGLLPLQRGAVDVDGRPVSGPASARGAVGLVFQRPESQFFALSVEEDCAFGPRNLGRSPAQARADARDALAGVGLDPDEFGPREPWSLSGGEARRAALAGVFAMRPRYLLMDEPTAGLDAAGRASVCAAIASLRAEAGVLVVTHDPESFLDTADSVLALREGRCVFEGDVPGFLAALPGLAAAGVVEPPEVPRTLLLARSRGARIEGALTLDPNGAASMLAAAVSAGEGSGS